MITNEQFHTLQPCRAGLQWALAQPSLAIAWDTCERGDWMWWLLCSRKGGVPKEISVAFAQDCACAARYAAADAARYAAADAARYAAADAARYAAAAAAADAARYADAAWDADAADAATWAADAAARAADAAADAAARAAERKRQADFIRTLVPNPFQP